MKSVLNADSALELKVRMHVLDKMGVEKFHSHATPHTFMSKVWHEEAISDGRHLDPLA